MAPFTKAQVPVPVVCNRERRSLRLRFPVVPSAGDPGVTPARCGGVEAQRIKVFRFLNLILGERWRCNAVPL